MESNTEDNSERGRHPTSLPLDLTHQLTQEGRDKDDEDNDLKHSDDHLSYSEESLKISDSRLNHSDNLSDDHFDSKPNHQTEIETIKKVDSSNGVEGVRLFPGLIIHTGGGEHKTPTSGSLPNPGTPVTHPTPEHAIHPPLSPSSSASSSPPPFPFHRFHFPTGGDIGNGVWWNAGGNLPHPSALPPMPSTDLLRNIPELHPFPGLPAFRE